MEHEQLEGYELVTFASLKAGDWFRYKTVGHDYKMVAMKGSNYVYMIPGYNALLSRSMYSPIWVWKKVNT